MNEAFAAAYPRVSLWLVAGGHLTERARPFLVTRAMEWLAKLAARKLAVAAGRRRRAEARALSSISAERPPLAR